MNSFDRWNSAEFDEEDGQEGEHSDDDDESYGGGPFNIGKAFLIPKARMSLYDEDIFGPSLLEARDMVRLSHFISAVLSAVCLYVAPFLRVVAMKPKEKIFLGTTSVDQSFFVLQVRVT